MWMFLCSHLDSEVCVVKGCDSTSLEYLYFTLTNAHKCMSNANAVSYRLKLTDPNYPSKVTTMIVKEYHNGEIEMYDENETYSFHRTPYAILP